MTFADLYILDGTNAPQVCRSVATWGRWRRSHDSALAEDEAGETVVRTSFLGVDVQVLDGRPPVTFNTEVFLAIDKGRHEHHLASEFYETYDQAMAGHRSLMASFKGVAGIIMGDKR